MVALNVVTRLGILWSGAMTATAPNHRMRPQYLGKRVHLDLTLCRCLSVVRGSLSLGGMPFLALRAYCPSISTLREIGTESG